MKLFTVIVAVILGFMLGVSCNYTPSKLGIIRALGNVDYQLYLTMDSAYVYDHNRYIGSCAHGNDGIDSVIRADRADNE